MKTTENTDKELIESWWRTSIIDMSPGKISLRGKPITDLIGNVSFPQMIWFMVCGHMPTVGQADLLEAALVAGVDHGPQAPSIAAARMATTCGLDLNNAMATGINMLGNVHGGAGEQCAELYYAIADKTDEGLNLNETVSAELAKWREKYGKIISGFGHRFHKPEDPRAPKLLELVRKAKENGHVTGKFVDIALAVQKEINQTVDGKGIPMNIDGATSVIFCELGFPPPLHRGLFCLSRSVGILSHAWEQMQQGGRNKGPMPAKFLPKFVPKGG